MASLAQVLRRSTERSACHKTIYTEKSVKFFPLVHNGFALGVVRIFGEKFVCQDKCLFENLHTKFAKTPA